MFFHFFFAETKVSEKKKLSEKIKEKENRLKKKQQEVKEKELEDKVSVFLKHMTIFSYNVCPHLNWFCVILLQEEELTPEQELEEKLRVQKLQEAADLELAKDAFGKNKSTFQSKLILFILFLSVNMKLNVSLGLFHSAVFLYVCRNISAFFLHNHCS